MTTIYLKNFEIEHTLSALSMVLQSQSNQDGANALTMYRLNKLTSDFQKEMEDYREFKKNLLNTHVEGGADKPKTKDNNLVFKSEEDEETFMNAMQAYTSVDLRCLLDEGDLREFNCSPYAIQWISKLLRSEAQTEMPEEMKEKEEKETNKKKPSKSKNASKQQKSE